MKKKQKEEVQSRRDFFKKAAKAALPILGSAVLASNPIIAKATETPMGCSYSCFYSCYQSCYQTCTGCRFECHQTCLHSCYQGCLTTCQGTCAGTCSANCRNNSY